MELKEVLAGQGVPLAVTDGDWRHNSRGALVIITVRGRDLERGAGRVRPGTFLWL